MKFSRYILALAMGVALAIPAALSLADSARSGHVPDPAGVAAKKQWVFDVQVRQGKPSLGTVREVVIDKPASTPSPSMPLMKMEDLAISVMASRPKVAICRLVRSVSIVGSTSI